MNTTHYPSFELCKKLKNIGFPNTSYNSIMLHQYELMTKGSAIVEVDENKVPVYFQIPNVMEMLDVIPKILKFDFEDKDYKEDLCEVNLEIFSYKELFCVAYYHPLMQKMLKGTLPNALAEIILWLHENNYISFSK